MILHPLRWLQRTSLVTQIVIAMIAGIALAVLFPAATPKVAILGTLFISALKAVAPVLVFILVIAAISNHKPGEATHVRPVLFLYLVGTLVASVVGVTASLWFPSTLVLQAPAQTANAPMHIQDVLLTLLMNVVDNPVRALMNANYIGILAWAVGFGMAMRHASAGTRTVMHDLSAGITVIIQVVIRFAPLGIFGLVASTFAEAGAQALWGYAHLLAVLLGCMVFVALVVNPLIVFLALRINPYPLVFTCLRESGVTAFFTRSSAANIPINLALAKRLPAGADVHLVSHSRGGLVGDAADLMKDNMPCQVLFFNDRPVEVTPPTFVQLEVTHSEPGVRGDTSGNVTKQATVETGAKINVPLFINIGDMIKIDTRTHEYVERVNKK